MYFGFFLFDAKSRVNIAFCLYLAVVRCVNTVYQPFSDCSYPKNRTVELMAKTHCSNAELSHHAVICQLCNYWVCKKIHLQSDYTQGSCRLLWGLDLLSTLFQRVKDGINKSKGQTPGFCCLLCGNCTSKHQNRKLFHLLRCLVKSSCWQLFCISLVICAPQAKNKASSFSIFYNNVAFIIYSCLFWMLANAFVCIKNMITQLKFKIKPTDV